MKQIEYNNVNFYIGQNATENWELLDSSKKINENFIWFHLNSFPSSYVIMYSTLDKLKIDNSQCDINNFLTFGANLCRENSKYKFLKDIKVIYTTVKKLKKTNKIGEVIISGKKNLIKLNQI